MSKTAIGQDGERARLGPVPPLSRGARWAAEPFRSFDGGDDGTRRRRGQFALPPFRGRSGGAPLPAGLAVRVACGSHRGVQLPEWVEMGPVMALLPLYGCFRAPTD